MSSKEFAEQMAYDRLEPNGEERADLRTGLICMVLANLKRDKKKKPAPYEIKDFLLRFEKEKRKFPSRRNLNQKITQIFGIFGIKKKAN